MTDDTTAGRSDDTTSTTGTTGTSGTSGGSIAGPVALVGAGEFTPAMVDVDAMLLEGRPARVAVIPTASWPDGEQTYRGWFDRAGTHYAGLGVEVVEVDVRERADADAPGVADLLSGVGLVYLSGGKPDHLSRTLGGSLLWTAVLDAWEQGAAVAGCSAGAMTLAAGWPPFLRASGPWGTGLGLVPDVAVLPHFDRFARWRPGGWSRVADRAPDGWRTLGVDEDTAVVHTEGDGWRVVGRGSATWLGDGERRPLEQAPPPRPAAPR